MKVLLAGAGHSSAEERRERSLGDSGHRDSIPKSCSQSQASTFSVLFLLSPKSYFSLLSFLSGSRPLQSTRTYLVSIVRRTILFNMVADADFFRA
jgi:hypothetical protein